MCLSEETEDSDYFSHDLKITDDNWFQCIVFRLEDGQTIVASRYGIDFDIEIGTSQKIGWRAENAVEVIDNGA